MQNAFIFARWFVRNHADNSDSLLHVLDNDADSLWNRFLSSDPDAIVASKTLVDALIPQLVQKVNSKSTKTKKTLTQTMDSITSNVSDTPVPEPAVLQNIVLEQPLDKPKKSKKSKKVTEDVSEVVDTPVPELTVLQNIVLEQPLDKPKKSKKSKKEVATEPVKESDTPVPEPVVLQNNVLEQPLDKPNKSKKSKKEVTTEPVKESDTPVPEPVVLQNNVLESDQPLDKPKKSKKSKKEVLMETEANVTEAESKMGSNIPPDELIAGSLDFESYDGTEEEEEVLLYTNIDGSLSDIFGAKLRI